MYASSAGDPWCSCVCFNYEIEENSCQYSKPSLHLSLMQTSFSWCSEQSPRCRWSGVPSCCPKAVGFFAQIQMSWPGKQQTLCKFLCGSCFISPFAVPSRQCWVSGWTLAEVDLFVFHPFPCLWRQWRGLMWTPQPRQSWWGRWQAGIGCREQKNPANPTERLLIKTKD